MPKVSDLIYTGSTRLLKQRSSTGTSEAIVIYILPGRFSGDEVRKQMRSEGPVATIYFTREGKPEASPVKILIGTFNSIVIGMLIGAAMLLLNRHTTNYWSHVAIGSTFGIAYTAYPRFADIIWSDFRGPAHNPRRHRLL